MIAIVNYGLGNLRSVQNMLQRAGTASVITSDPAEIRAARKLILPGVGHFGFGMEELRKRRLIEVLNERVLEAKVPVLGICLGAQLLARGSEEGPAEGLGWLDMDVVAFDRARLGPTDRVPHMGWADISCLGHPLFARQCDPRFYFVHSFHFLCDDPETVVATAVHGYRFAAGVARGNIMGVQFHPEKSHTFGLELLQAFAAMPGGS